VKVERGPMGTTDSTALVDPAGDARTVQRYIDLGLPIYCGGGHGNFVALTFDDGPGAYTQRTLDMLRAAGDTATFFLVGRNLDAWASLPKQERALGAVGDHTWNHIALTGVSPSEQQREIERTKGAEEALIGGPLMLFRPPLASRNSEVDRLVHDLGLLEIIWTVDSRDSAGVGPALTYQNVIEGLKPGAIILMHENRGATLQDLPSILDAVARAGLRTVTVPQLLRLDPPTPEQVRRSAGEGACVPG
jgi:peptidoglycan/xylan/chitin deacetylase (PgdA/CDA1 family)